MQKQQKLTSLTGAQRDRMASFAQEWIQHGWRTQPLTEEEWAVWEAGARKCYEFAGIPWPNRVIRVPSPIVGAFAAPLAASALELIRKGEPGSAVDSAVRSAVGSAVDSAVDSAVYSAVYSAVGSAVRSSSKLFWHNRFGGRMWCYWPAFIAYFRDVVELQLDGDTWQRSKAYEDAQSAGWWWPNRDFVMVCDLPTVQHVESAGAGQYRLHCETGPAVAWADGWGLHYWHGTAVPSWVIENPTVEKALAEPNSEVRRSACEAIGWDRVLAHLDAAPIDVCPDPANSPHELKLYRLPDNVNPYGQAVNLLLMTNGSPDRSGVLRQYGETVPASIKSAEAAAGWQYGLNPSVYRQLERRT